MTLKFTIKLKFINIGNNGVVFFATVNCACSDSERINCLDLNAQIKESKIKYRQKSLSLYKKHRLAFEIRHPFKNFTYRNQNVKLSICKT